MFNGPPETSKNFILNSSCYLMKGDYVKCLEMLGNLKVYNIHKTISDIKATITNKVKQTSLKCFLILYSNEANSFSLDYLHRKFNLEKKTITSIINNMILNHELYAKWNFETLEISNFGVNLRQKMIKKLHDNLNTITENNLSLMEIATKIN